MFAVTQTQTTFGGDPLVIGIFGLFASREEAEAYAMNSEEAAVEIAAFGHSGLAYEFDVYEIYQP